MNQRPSLMEQAGIGSQPGPGKPKGSGGGLDPQKLKIAGVAALLLVAIAVVTWGMGLWTGRPKVDRAEQAERRARLDEEVKDDQKRDARAPEPVYEDAGG